MKTFEEWARPQIARLRRRYERLVRTCDQCGEMFLANGNHRRDHAFCSEEHRRAFDQANRDPKQAAAYMRQWRVKNRADR